MHSGHIGIFTFGKEIFSSISHFDRGASWTRNIFHFRPPIKPGNEWATFSFLVEALYSFSCRRRKFDSFRNSAKVRSRCRGGEVDNIAFSPVWFYNSDRGIISSNSTSSANVCYRLSCRKSYWLVFPLSGRPARARRGECQGVVEELKSRLEAMEAELAKETRSVILLRWK